MQQQPIDGRISRRDLLRSGAALPLAAMVPLGVHSGGTNTIRVGLVGCGGRGTGAANDCASSSPNVELVTMGDLFADRLKTSRENLQQLGPAMKVTDDTCFTGFDAYQKVLAADIDLVILATPPGFRPMHLEAAVKAGKHVFMEKPVAVCPAGVRQVIAASELATQKNLNIVAGTQRRHQAPYIETIRRIHEGAIGEVVAARCYWNQGFLWALDKRPEWSDTEWQLRNWLYFTWLSGDHIVEQHIHNLDVINWVMGAPPTQARAMGGRQVRVAERFGHIYDHFAVEYRYPNGAHLTSMCRQIDNTWRQVGEEVDGTKGRANPGGSIRGEIRWQFKSADRVSPYVQEHADLIASIRNGEPLNEGRRVAESTLTAIMGRMSAYTGEVVTWEFALEKSQLDLRPNKLELGDRPVDAVAMPGITPLI